MDLGIRGRVALVAAAAGGLGLATAERLAMEGCDVAICDVDPKVHEGPLAKVLAAGNGVRGAAFTVDLTDATAIESLVTDVKSELGSIDILVTNSGGPPPGTFDTATDELWQFAFELTFLSAVRMIRQVLPDMKASGWGRIVNFSSRAFKEPIPNLMLSNAARLAVAGMAKTLASEVAGYGITVNNVGPGPTMTDRTMQLAAVRAEKNGTTTEVELEATARRIPRGRLAEPEEQAAVVAFLASTLAGHITGTSLLVDGGETGAL